MKLPKDSVLCSWSAACAPALMAARIAALLMPPRLDMSSNLRSEPRISRRTSWRKDIATVPPSTLPLSRRPRLGAARPLRPKKGTAAAATDLASPPPLDSPRNGELSKRDGQNDKWRKKTRSEAKRHKNPPTAGLCPQWRLARRRSRKEATRAWLRFLEFTNPESLDARPGTEIPRRSGTGSCPRIFGVLGGGLRAVRRKPSTATSHICFCALTNSQSVVRGLRVHEACQPGTVQLLNERLADRISGARGKHRIR